MYNKDMKSVFRYAIELDVLNIRTQKGYKGADILVIETEHEKVAILIKNFCHNIKIDTNVKRKKIFTINCIFGKDIYAVDDVIEAGVYDLKL